MKQPGACLPSFRNLVAYKALAATLLVMLVLASCDTPEETGPEKLSVTSTAAPAQVAEVEPEPEPQPDAAIENVLPEKLLPLAEPWFGDLDGMAERRVIRALVVSGGPQFFYYRGKPRGVMSELLQRYQTDLNNQLGRGLDAVEVVPMPGSRDRLLDELVAGRADLVAADLTVTEERFAKVDFSIPIMRGVDEFVVFGPGHGKNIKGLDDLAGRSLYVRASSSYYEHLARLNDDFRLRGLEPLRIDAANEFLRTLDIVDMVNAGLVSGTVLDSYKAKNLAGVFSDLQVREDLVVNSGGTIAWAFRKDSPLLAETVNKFLREHRQGTLIGNVLIKRYVENVDWVINATSDSEIERVRPILELFRASAAESGFDPLMLVAQAYQESGLDHEKRSSAGAEGIMQIKPSTAADKNVGIPDISTVADNIRAGARYMRFLEDRYFSSGDMNELEQWLFALAAYNAGPAKIQRIRNRATAEGRDPNRWLDNVELVAARQIGRETVRYVRNIFKYYVAYRLAWERRELRQSLGATEH